MNKFEAGLTAGAAVLALGGVGAEAQDAGFARQASVRIDSRLRGRMDLLALLKP